MVAEGIDFNRPPVYFFVYGTLMSGLPNHFYLKSSRFESDAWTKELYGLYYYHIPYVNEHDRKVQIQGEVWEVYDAKTVLRMDHLEQHPDWYYRKKVEILGKNGRIYSCWMYFNNFDNPNYLLDHGNYRQIYEEEIA